MNDSYYLNLKFSIFLLPNSTKSLGIKLINKGFSPNSSRAYSA